MLHVWTMGSLRMCFCLELGEASTLEFSIANKLWAIV